MGADDLQAAGDPLADGIDAWLGCARRGAVLVVTLNRPERRNAMTWEQIAQIGVLLGRAAQDDTIRAVVVHGAQGTFSAGGDVKDQASRRDWDVAERVDRSRPLLDGIEAVWDFPKPLIAAIDGVATGAGMGLALLCDVRLASASARVGFAFVHVGLGPDYGVSFTLPRAVGPGHAARLLYTGALIDAEEARAIGLVERVVPDGEVLDAALALADEIAGRPPFGVQLAKLGLRRTAAVDFSGVLGAELQGQFLAMSTTDHQEAARAFAERSAKRPAPTAEEAT